jgi:hypothetical protein
LYLASNTVEKHARIPTIRENGEPILGLAKFLDRHPEVADLMREGRMDVVLGPTDPQAPTADSSAATTHVGFSIDPATHSPTIARILNS